MLPDNTDFKALHSYSQDGEDMLLRPLLMETIPDYTGYKGFYIDIGAYHPAKHSNTMHFYELGWSGINIEPTPAAINLFNQYRERDINLNIGLGPERTRRTLYCFSDPAFNTFDAQNRADKTGQQPVTQTAEVEIYPLAQVLDEHLPAGKRIDFMSVDVAGLDVSLLQSNNWEKYRPTFILVEDVDKNASHLDASDAYSFLAEQGYKQVGTTPRTLIFKQL
jgi:FkbM family methyltransferase